VTIEPTVTQVSAAGRLFGFTGTPTLVRFESGALWVFATVDDIEHDERDARRVDPVLDLGLLAALSELPHRMPVPWTSLDEHTRTVLTDPPPGLIRRDSGMVERLVRRPVRVSGAFACGRWSAASRHVGPLGTLCEVGVLTPQRPRPSGNPVLEAAVYGQGLAWRSPDGDVHLVQRPERSLRVPGPYQWWMCEQVYAAVTATTVTAPTTA